MIVFRKMRQVIIAANDRISKHRLILPLRSIEDASNTKVPRGFNYIDTAPAMAAPPNQDDVSSHKCSLLGRLMSLASMLSAHTKSIRGDSVYMGSRCMRVQVGRVR